MKLGVITDGISRDFETALKSMSDVGIQQAELQYLWDKEIGDLDNAETKRAKELLDRYEMRVPIISRHLFGGIPLIGLSPSMSVFRSCLDELKRCFDAAHEFSAPLVRVMSFRKEMVLFGSNGAEIWNVSANAWEKLVELFHIIAESASREKMVVALETGNNGNVNTATLGRRLCDELGSQWVKILWDPTNAIFADECPYPYGYERLRGDLLAHVHIKDARVSIRGAEICCTTLGGGHLAQYLPKIAGALKQDGYSGTISLESVYKPEGEDFKDGFDSSLAKFRELFG